MVRGNNYTVQQVLQRLRTKPFNGFCDEDEETDLKGEDLISTCNAGVESFDCDTDSSEDEQESVVASVATFFSVATPDNS